MFGIFVVAAWAFDGRGRDSANSDATADHVKLRMGAGASRASSAQLRQELRTNCPPGHACNGQTEVPMSTDCWDHALWMNADSTDLDWWATEDLKEIAGNCNLKAATELQKYYFTGLMDSSGRYPVDGLRSDDQHYVQMFTVNFENHSYLSQYWHRDHERTVTNNLAYDRNAMQDLLKLAYPRPRSCYKMMTLWGKGHGPFGFGDGTGEDGVHHRLTVGNIEQEIQSAMGDTKVDLLAFDGSLMSTYDVLSQLADRSEYYLLSEDVFPSHGLPYNTMEVINISQNNRTLTPIEVGELIIREFVRSSNEQPRTLSLISSSGWKSFQGHFDKFLDFLAHELQNGRHEAKAYLGKSRQYVAVELTNPDVDSWSVEQEPSSIDLGQLIAGLTFWSTQTPLFHPNRGEEAMAALYALHNASRWLKSGHVIVKNGVGSAEKNFKYTGVSLFFPMRGTQYSFPKLHEYASYLEEHTMWYRTLSAYFNFNAPDMPHDLTPVRDRSIVLTMHPGTHLLSIQGLMSPHIVGAKMYMGQVPDYGNIVDLTYRVTPSLQPLHVNLQSEKADESELKFTSDFLGYRAHWGNALGVPVFMSTDGDETRATTTERAARVFVDYYEGSGDCSGKPRTGYIEAVLSQSGAHADVLNETDGTHTVGHWTLVVSMDEGSDLESTEIVDFSSSEQPGSLKFKHMTMRPHCEQGKVVRPTLDAGENACMPWNRHMADEVIYFEKQYPVAKSIELVFEMETVEGSVDISKARCRKWEGAIECRVDGDVCTYSNEDLIDELPQKPSESEQNSGLMNRVVNKLISPVSAVLSGILSPAGGSGR